MEITVSKQIEMHKNGLRQAEERLACYLEYEPNASKEVKERIANCRKTIKWHKADIRTLSKELIVII